MQGPFTIEQRARVRDYILRRARSDRRVLAGAVVGSEALGKEDRWSDLDLTFGLAPGVSPGQVLEEWTPELMLEFDAVHLFDLPRKTSLYRVFLLPGNLQVDLSFTTGFVPQFGPDFRLLFGGPVKFEPATGRSPTEMFGYGAHHAVRARFCVERGKRLQAEYWISGVRDEALALACHRYRLETSYGRGFDLLPAELWDRASRALVRSLDRVELLRALGEAVDLMLQQADELPTLRDRLAPQLKDLSSVEWT